MRGFLGTWVLGCACVRGFLLICLPVCVRGSLGVRVCVGTWVRGFLLICVPVRGYLGPCVRGCAQFCPW